MSSGLVADAMSQRVGRRGRIIRYINKQRNLNMRK